MVQRFSRQGVGLMMTLEVPDLFRSERLSDGAVSHLSDNVVLLNYIYERDSIKRAVSVIKSRASYHEPDVRPFVIGPDGIALADRPAREELG